MFQVVLKWVKVKLQMNPIMSLNNRTISSPETKRTVSKMLTVTIFIWIHKIQTNNKINKKVNDNDLVIIIYICGAVCFENS